MQVEMFVWCNHCNKSLSTFELEHKSEVATEGNCSTIYTHLLCPTCHNAISSSYYWDNQLSNPYKPPTIYNQ